MITLASTTRIAVHVLVDDDTGSAAALIMAVAVLVNTLVMFGQFVNEVVMWAGLFVEAAHVTNTLFVIAFRSLAFGMGVRL